MEQRELVKVAEGQGSVGAVELFTDRVESLRLLVDQFPAVFWTTDTNLRFTSSLGAGLAALGLGANQLVGMALGDLFEAEQAQPIQAHVRALNGHSVTYLMHWGGRAFHSQVAPLRDANGRVMGTICVAMDLHGSDGQPVSSEARAQQAGHHEEWRFLAPG
jgi:PAS domain-containing protein